MSGNNASVIGYQCETCGNVRAGSSILSNEMPEGYFVTLFFCSKECLIDFQEQTNKGEKNETEK